MLGYIPAPAGSVMGHGISHIVMALMAFLWALRHTQSAQLFSIEILQTTSRSLRSPCRPRSRAYDLVDQRALRGLSERCYGDLFGTTTTSTWLLTLWLCQNSYGKWPFIVDLPIENGDFP